MAEVMCAACGAPNAESLRYCEKCGAEFGRQTPDPQGTEVFQPDEADKPPA